MTYALKTAAALSVFCLAACGGGSGSSSSNDFTNVTGPKKQDCGDPISLAKNYDHVTRYDTTSRRPNSDSPYVWPNSSTKVEQSYVSFNGSSEINVTDGEFIEPCSWAQESFAYFTPSVWEGEDDPLFPKNGQDVYFTPVITMTYDVPSFQTYEAWKEANKPEFENTTIVDAKLYVKYASMNSRGLGDEDEDIIEATPRLKLECDRPYQLRYHDQREDALGNISPDACEIQFDGERESWYQCLHVVPKRENNTCTFTTDKVFIPDNQGNYYEAAVAGKLHALGEDDYRIEVNEIDILN